jgi:hypothetical protein
VKRQKLEQLMREHGAEIKREGAKHTIWFIPATGQKSTVPRHNEIKKNTARAICKQLGIDPEKVTGRVPGIRRTLSSAQFRSRSHSPPYLRFRRQPGLKPMKLR